VTQKALESIFVDPVFDHKNVIRNDWGATRAKAVQKVSLEMKDMERKLNNPKNYKKFFWSRDMEMFGFGVPNKIRDIVDTKDNIELVSMNSED